MTNQLNDDTWRMSEAPDDQPDLVVIRERKKTRKKHKHRKKRRVPLAAKVLGVIFAILVIGAGVAFAFINYNIAKGDEQLHAPTVEETGRVIEYKGHAYEFNEDVVPILILGKDDESNYGFDRSCADANMLVTLDTKTKALNVIALPRDAMVDVDLYQNGEFTRTAKHQLAVAYGVDVADDDAAARNTMKSVSTLFYNLPIERYFVLEMDAVGELATAVGGVKVEALATYPGASFEVGDTVLLEGESALKYVRYRDINVDKSAQDRQERQMQFIKAFVAKLRTIGVNNIMELYNMVQRSTYTNLDLSEITYLVSVFADGRAATTEYSALSGETKLEADDDGVEREHIYLDEDSVMDATLKAFYAQVR